MEGEEQEDYSAIRGGLYDKELATAAPAAEAEQEKPDAPKQEAAEGGDTAKEESAAPYDDGMAYEDAAAQDGGYETAGYDDGAYRRGKPPTMMTAPMRGDYYGDEASYDDAYETEPVTTPGKRPMTTVPAMILPGTGKPMTMGMTDRTGMSPMNRRQVRSRHTMTALSAVLPVKRSLRAAAAAAGAAGWIPDR